MTTSGGPSEHPQGRPASGDAVKLESDRTLGPYFADVPNRLIGYLIDAVLLTILSVAGAVVISAIFGPVVTIDLAADPRVRVDRALALANAALGTAISAAYFIGTWRRLRGSPGQRLLHMRIGGEADDRPVSYGQGVVRWLFIGLPLGVEASLTALLSGLTDALLLLALAGWYLVLLVGTARSPTKQGLHDRVAHTVVTKLARAVPWADRSDPGQGAGVR